MPTENGVLLFAYDNESIKYTDEQSNFEKKSKKILSEHQSNK